MAARTQVPNEADSPMMTWTLIFAADHGTSVQVFTVRGDPELRARELVVEHQWLNSHTLIAAVEGASRVMVRDDAQDRFTLQPTG